MRQAALAIAEEEEEDQTRSLRPKRDRIIKSFAGLLDDDEEEEDEAAAANTKKESGATGAEKSEDEDDFEYAGPKSKRRKIAEAPTWRREATPAKPAVDREDGFEEAHDDDDD